MNNEFFVSQLRTMVLDPNNNETVLNPNTNKSVSDSTQNANFPGCRILSKILPRNR